jgi:hypothetical protein
MGFEVGFSVEVVAVAAPEVAVVGYVDLRKVLLFKHGPFCFKPKEVRQQMRIVHTVTLKPC